MQPMSPPAAPRIGWSNPEKAVAAGGVIGAVLLVVAGFVFSGAHPAGIGFSGGPPPSGGSPPWSVRMASIDISFVGDAASVFVAQPACPTDCGTFYSGHTAAEQFDVGFTTGSICGGPQYRISDASVSSTGAWVLDKVSAFQGSARTGPLPVVVPLCSGAGGQSGTTIYLGLSVVQQGPSVQTLFVTVTVNQV